jgi:hypothetical protein
MHTLSHFGRNYSFWSYEFLVQKTLSLQFLVQKTLSLQLFLIALEDFNET